MDRNAICPPITDHHSICTSVRESKHLRVSVLSSRKQSDYHNKERSPNNNMKQMNSQVTVLQQLHLQILLIFLCSLNHLVILWEASCLGRWNADSLSDQTFAWMGHNLHVRIWELVLHLSLQSILLQRWPADPLQCQGINLLGTILTVNFEYFNVIIRYFTCRAEVSKLTIICCINFLCIVYEWKTNLSDYPSQVVKNLFGYET